MYKPVKGLSGGERARVLLLKLMLSKANLLILDEPTNHLDIGSCEALEDALMGYDGTLLVVSHDRYLINKLADKIYYLEPTARRSTSATTTRISKRGRKRRRRKPLCRRASRSRTRTS